MANVAILADTIACLPGDILKEYEIGIVPVTLVMDGTGYRDRVDITPEEFWKKFDDMKEFTTAAPSIEEYNKLFEETSKKTDRMAIVIVSKALSATHEVAVQARDIFVKEHPGVQIEVIDSRTAAGAEGFITLEMARAARAGNSLEDVVKVAEEMIPRVRFVCAMETMKLLIKIGRAPKTAYMGELFQVKPIIGMVNNTGVVENLGRARGLQKTLEKMLDLMAEYIDPAKPSHINVHYTQSIETGKKMKAMVEAKFKTDELFFTPYSPVMCGAVGPVNAISFYQ